MSKIKTSEDVEQWWMTPLDFAIGMVAPGKATDAGYIKGSPEWAAYQFGYRDGFHEARDIALKQNDKVEQGVAPAPTSCSGKE